MSEPRPPLLLRLALRLYPQAFRERHGRELAAAIPSALAGAARRRGYWRARARLLTDLLGGALAAWSDQIFHIDHPLEALAMTVDRIRSDLSLAARRLLAAPAFTAVVVLTIALGVGASTAVFTLVNGVLLRPMPYPSPEKLVYLWSGLDWVGVPRAWMSGPHLGLLRERADRFEGFAAMRVGSMVLEQEQAADARAVTIGLTTGDLFGLLGVRAALGRTLLPSEQGADAPQVAVLTHALWASAFGADPAIVGNDVRLDGDAYRVVGVMPPDFRFAMHSSLGDPTVPEMWVPLARNLADDHPGNFSNAILGRIGDGVTWQEALSQLDAIAADYGGEAYGRDEFRFRMVPLHGDLVRDVRPALLMLAASVALVLLIVCSNVATLFLGRALAASREIAVRNALGAGVTASVTPLVIESLLVSAVGGAVGLWMTHAGIGTVLSMAPAELPRADEISIDPLVIGCGVLLTALVGGSAGLLPLYRQRRVDVATVLRDGSRGSTATGRRTQHGLVVTQVALSALLLAGTFLMARSMSMLLGIDPGFETRDAQVLGLLAPEHRFADESELPSTYEALRQQLAAVAGVRAIGLTDTIPLSGDSTQNPYGISGAPGSTGDDEHDNVLADHLIVSPGYFAAMGVELLEGRGFGSEDTADGRPVAVIDETLARRFWPGGGAVGGVLTAYGNGQVDVAVVGVARHARLHDIRRDDRHQVYRPMAQLPERRMMAVVAGVDGPIPAERLRAITAEQAPGVTLEYVRAMSERLDAALASSRFLTRLLGGFAAAALLLAALGVYGVIAVSVADRRHEIGIRMALGAGRRQVGRAVLADGLRLAAIGLAIGVAALALAGRLLAGLLYGVGTFDLASIAGVTIVLSTIAALAAWLPARRATRVAPSEAFRSK